MAGSLKRRGGQSFLPPDICSYRSEIGHRFFRATLALLATYRYSEEGIGQLARKATRQTSLITGLALLAGVLIPFFNGAISQPFTLIPILVIFAAVAIWSGKRAGGKVRATAGSTEIEIGFEGNSVLIASTPTARTTLDRDEVVELRYLKDGVLVRCKGLRKTLLLRPELNEFENLVNRVEEWTPAGVPRIRSSGSFSGLAITLVLANLGLFMVAYQENPKIAVPASVVEALILLSRVTWVWRSESVARRLKWLMLIATGPAISLLGRAYLLWTQR